LSISFQAYEEGIEKAFTALEIPASAFQVGPFVTPTIPTQPNRAPWRLDWALFFDDGMHISIKECFRERPAHFGGEGERATLAFHYGATPPGRDLDGLHLRHDSLVTVLRIDVDRKGPHIHYDGRDHIGQSKVEGLTIATADPVLFAKNVLAHRATGQALHLVSGFRVRQHG
jgi:hypothetical protein